MGAILSALVDHPRVVISIACAVLLALGGYALYHAGESAQSARSAAALVASQRSADSAIASIQAAIAPVKRQNDSLQLSNRTLSAQRDSAARSASKAHAHADTVLSRLVASNDTASVTTDTGVAVIPIPHVLALQLSDERRATDSAFADMQRRDAASAALIAGQADEIAGLRVQIGLDSVATVQYRKSLADAEARVAQAEAAPHRTFKQGLVGGALATLAVVTTLAIAF